MTSLADDPTVQAIAKALYGETVSAAEFAKSLDASDVHIDGTIPKMKRPKKRSATDQAAVDQVAAMARSGGHDVVVRKTAGDGQPAPPGQPPNKKKLLAAGLLAGTAIEGMAAKDTIEPLARAVNGLAPEFKDAAGVGAKVKALRPLATPSAAKTLAVGPAGKVLPATAGPGTKAALQVGNFGVGIAAAKELGAKKQPGTQPPGVSKALRVALKPVGQGVRAPSLKARRPGRSPMPQQTQQQNRSLTRPVPMGKALDAYGEISKVDTDLRQVFGWANVSVKDGVEVLDRQGDVFPIEELEKAAYDYVLDCRVGGDQHSRIGKGVATDWGPKHTADIIESMVFTPDKIEKMGLPADFPQGWWIGMQVHDDETWNLIKSGKRTGFSVHGAGRREALNKADKRKESGAAITGAGATVAGVGAVAGGVPGSRPNGMVTFEMQRKEGERVPPSKAGRAIDQVRRKSKAVKALPGGILGYRTSVHQFGTEDMEAKHAANERARQAKPRESRTDAYYRGYNHGKIAPEKAIIRGMKVGQGLSHGAVAAGVGAAAYGVHRARQPVAKADNSDTYHATLAGAGASSAVIAHVGSKYLGGQKKKFERRAARNIDEAAAYAPKLAGRLHPKMSEGQLHRYFKKNPTHTIEDIPRGHKPRVSDGEIGRRPSLLQGVSASDAHRAGQLRGAAKQADHFAHVFGTTGKAVKSIRNPSAIIAGVSAGGLIANRQHKQPVAKADKRRGALAERAHQAAHPPAVIRSQRPDSSAVRSIGYQKQTRKLDVEMRSRPDEPYSYRVKPDTAKSVIDAPSLGRAYTQQVRGKAPHHTRYTVADRARLAFHPQREAS